MGNNRRYNTLHTMVNQLSDYAVNHTRRQLGDLSIPEIDSVTVETNTQRNGMRLYLKQHSYYDVLYAINVDEIDPREYPDESDAAVERFVQFLNLVDYLYETDEDDELPEECNEMERYLWHLFELLRSPFFSYSDDQLVEDNEIPTDMYHGDCHLDEEMIDTLDFSLVVANLHDECINEQNQPGFLSISARNKLIMLRRQLFQEIAKKLVYYRDETNLADKIFPMFFITKAPSSIPLYYNYHYGAYSINPVIQSRYTRAPYSRYYDGLLYAFESNNNTPFEQFGSFIRHNMYQLQKAYDLIYN